MIAYVVAQHYRFYLKKCPNPFNGRIDKYKLPAKQSLLPLALASTFRSRIRGSMAECKLQ